MADVFVSYSHKDEKWKDRLLVHLGVLEKQGLLDVWEDGRIGDGEDWYKEIERAIDAAKIAILLVSANFLSSDFVLREEIPRLLRRRHSQGTYVIPIVVTPCVYEKVGWLGKMHVDLMNGKALSAGTRHQIEEYFAAFAGRIIEYLQKKPAGTSHRPGPVRRIKRREKGEVPVKVFFADDHPLVQRAVGALLEQEPNVKIIGTACGSYEAIRMIQKARPDIAVMDLSLPYQVDGGQPDVRTGSAAVRRILREFPDIRVIVLSMYDDEELIDAMFRAGVCAYVNKADTAEEFVRALRVVVHGGVYISQALGGRRSLGYVGRSGNGDPERKERVLQLILKGYNTKKIMEELHMSIKTIERCIWDIMGGLTHDNVERLLRVARNLKPR